MCVVAIAIDAHPHWRLIVAGNRDEYHARASAPLDRWNDNSSIIAGRDLVAGGSWLGISETGRFAVVTNIRDADGPNPEKLSRGALVTEWLGHGKLPVDSGAFNPFNLIVIGGDGASYLANRPSTTCKPLSAGVFGLSNAIPNEHWPRKERLIGEMKLWLEQQSDDPKLLLDLLRDETLPDREAHPIFIRSPVYGTRCSTVVVVDHDGRGQIIERRFDADGNALGDVRLDFGWPV